MRLPKNFSFRNKKARNGLLLCILLVILIKGCINYQQKSWQGYIEGRYTQMSSSVGGKLIRLSVSRGNYISQGQLLFVLEDQPEAAKLNQAEAQMDSEKATLVDASLGERSTVIAARVAQRDQAVADLEKLKRDYDRNRELYLKGVVDKATYENAEYTYQAAEHRVDELDANIKESKLGDRFYRVLAQSNTYRNAEAQAAEARWRLTQKKVFAPTEGFIFDTYFNEGEQISAFQPVLSLLAPENIKVIFFVPEPDLSKLRRGGGIEFKCGRCKERFTGKIDYISPQAEFTPPVIFSRERREKLVYKIEAAINPKYVHRSYPGQPVDVFLINKKK